ncbi:MAG: hypothetical protein EB084_20615 [Proteobacteria bacterium]|nr:hypothetical protein [Pseudomonadota bacterium]
MSDQMAVALQRMLTSIVSLGLFSICALTYGLFVMHQPLGEQAAQESRARSLMLTGACTLAAFISHLALDLIGEGVNVCRGYRLQAPEALGRLVDATATAPPALAWGVIGAVVLVTLAISLVPDDARRARLNKLTAGVLFVSGAWLLFLAIGLHGLRSALIAAGSPL